MPAPGHSFHQSRDPVSTLQYHGLWRIIAVTAVNADGAATAFSVMIPNSGNKVDDGTDDTLVGIVNNSGAGLTSITLTRRT
jgi:thiamine biosynthesis lipoprotein ApbE